MSEITRYNGDDLLQVFKNLNIDLGNLNPDVVRAWFDTDNDAELNLLNFMCSSLSQENVLTPQESLEFEATEKLKEKPLYGPDLENSMKLLEGNYPGIFDYETNYQQLKFSLEELDQLQQEEQKLDNLINIDDSVHQHLLQQKSDLEKEMATLEFKCKEASERCQELSGVLDETNKCLYVKLSKDLSQLSSFQFSNTSEFLNRTNLQDIQDTEEFYASIQEVVKKQQEDLSSSFSESKIYLNSTPNDEDSLKDNLEIHKNRIFLSHVKYLGVKVEEESLVEVLHYLENFFMKDLLSNCNNSISEDMLNMKQNQKEILLDMLRKSAIPISEEPITDIKIQRAKEELKSIEDNSVCFSQIFRYYSTVLCICSCSLMLYLQEKKCIENSDTLIRHISRYILNSLENSKERTDFMLNVTKKFNNYKSRPLEFRNEILNRVIRLYQGNMLEDAFLSHAELNKNLLKLESDCFGNDSSELSIIYDEIFRKDVVKSFLNSGPTVQMVVIPHEIQKSLNNIRYNLDKQTAAIKFLIQITQYNLKKLKADDWLKRLRLVWVYFLVDPNKLDELLAQLNGELKAKETRTVRFKD